MTRIEFTLIPVTPFTLTVSDVFKDLYNIKNLDLNFIFHVSSIKGMLRTASIFGFRTLLGDGYSCEDMYNKTCPELTEEERKGLKMFPCPVCKTYGMLRFKGCSFFVKNLNEIVSAREELKYRFLFIGPYLVLVSKKPIDVLVVCNDKCSHLVILLGLYYVNIGIIRLGRFRSRGLGIFRVEIKDQELQKLFNDVSNLKEELRKCLRVRLS